MENINSLEPGAIVVAVPVGDDVVLMPIDQARTLRDWLLGNLPPKRRVVVPKVKKVKAEPKSA